MKVTFTNPPCQQQIPWGSAWYDAARELAAARGVGIVAVSVARRVQLGDGQWYAVTFDDGKQQYELIPVA